MDQNRTKNAARWFYGQVFRDEPIRPRPQVERKPMPSLLRAARSLENQPSHTWQSRESIFLKQGKLLANYEDDFLFDKPIQRYFPTYQSLSDEELRGYFSWRTKLRRGVVQKTSLSFAFLYIYELINQIGVADPMDGFRKLESFRDSYGQLDDSILPYLRRWLVDYAVFYDLDPSLLAYTPQVLFDRNLTVLDHIREQPDAKVFYALTQLSGKWLERSKFYAQYKADFETVAVSVFGRVWEHYDKGCKRSMVEQYFGPLCRFQVRLFDNAVFGMAPKPVSRIYEIDERYRYRCEGGLWTVEKHAAPLKPNGKLTAILKTIDAVMREAYDFPNLIRAELDTKWLLAIIREEVHALLRKQREAEAKRQEEEARKLRFDLSSLEKIRREAAATETKLYVEEEPEEFMPPCDEASPVQEAVQPVEEEAGSASDLPLTDQELRLLRTLLYGGDMGWIRREGLLLSVLVDSVNDKLFDIFGDSVLLTDEPPELIEDYMEELKEMVTP